MSIFADQPSELVLTESRTMRAQTAGRVDVLDKVKALSLLPDGMHADIAVVACYYEVDFDAIESVIRRNREELSENGMRVLRGEEYRAFVSANLTDANPKARSLTVLPRRAILNVGQGLPAWLMLHYRPDAPLRTAEQAAEHDEDCNLPENSIYVEEWGPCDGTHHRRPTWLTVSFDTAYGHRDDRGYGCGDLHAEYIAKLGQWLDARGVRWEWKNEFTGDVHTGYSRLIDLASGGFEASAWFRTSVLPVIEAEVRKGGA